MFLCSDRLDYSLQIGNIHTYVHKSMLHDIVEAHCYFVDIGRTDREQICSRINNNDCRRFRPRSPLPTAYKILYAVDESLLRSLLLILLRICSMLHGCALEYSLQDETDVRTYVHTSGLAVGSRVPTGTVTVGIER